MYYVIDIERTLKNKEITYWNENQFGYTSHILEAGMFSEEDAKAICNDDITGFTVMRPTE